MGKNPLGFFRDGSREEIPSETPRGFVIKGAICLQVWRLQESNLEDKFSKQNPAISCNAINKGSQTLEFCRVRS